jgi:hypothetical protein
MGKMRTRTILIALLVIQLSLVGGLIATALRMQATRGLVSFRLADEPRQSSDDLTRFARAFATTGDERYFHEVPAIRNGEVPRPEGQEEICWDLIAADPDRETADGEQRSLRGRMLAAGFTNAEFDMPAESRNQSDALVRIGAGAMNAVQVRFDEGTGAFALVGPPDRDDGATPPPARSCPSLAARVPRTGGAPSSGAGRLRA